MATPVLPIRSRRYCAVPSNLRHLLSYRYPQPYSLSCRRRDPPCQATGKEIFSLARTTHPLVERRWQERPRPENRPAKM
jgi:hypothetical protein